MHIHWLRGYAYTHQKSVKRALLSVVVMDSFLFRQDLVMPILEGPKMELQTFVLSLCLGLLAAFHQRAEVNIFHLQNHHLLPLKFKSLLWVIVKTVEMLLNLTSLKS